MSKLKYHKKDITVPCIVKQKPLRVSFQSPKAVVFEIDEQVRVMARSKQKSSTSPRFTYDFAKISKVNGDTVQVELEKNESMSSQYDYCVEIPPERLKKRKRYARFRSLFESE